MASRALNMSCYFSQSARSIVSTCVVTWRAWLRGMPTCFVSNFNSFAPESCGSAFRSIIFNPINWNNNIGSHCQIATIPHWWFVNIHYDDVIIWAMASQITSLTIVYSTVDSDADERKHQSSASLAFVRGIHRWPMNSPHKWPVSRKMSPFDDVIMWFG